MSDWSSDVCSSDLRLLDDLAAAGVNVDVISRTAAHHGIGRPLASLPHLRLGGTVAGAAVAYGILASDPPTIVLLIAVAVLQVLIELLVARNYGIAVIAITPIALVMSQVAAPAEAGAMAIDRMVTAGAGVLVTVVLLVAGRLLALAMGSGSLRPS